MSSSVAEYKDPHGIATVELVKEVARLAMSACSDVTAQPELPGAGPVEGIAIPTEAELPPGMTILRQLGGGPQ